MEMLVPIVESSGGTASSTLEVALAGLALGMIFVGKCDGVILIHAAVDECLHGAIQRLCKLRMSGPATVFTKLSVM